VVPDAADHVTVDTVTPAGSSKVTAPVALPPRVTLTRPCLKPVYPATGLATGV
jgi:hypothetical protein